MRADGTTQEREEILRSSFGHSDSPLTLENGAAHKECHSTWLLSAVLFPQLLIGREGSEDSTSIDSFLSSGDSKSVSAFLLPAFRKHSPANALDFPRAAEFD